MISDIFKTGTARTVYYILRGQTFFHHLLQMTVNGRGSDGNPFFPEKIADFIHGNMSSLYRFQEGKFGSAGFKILASKDAKKVYTQTTAAVLRVRIRALRAHTCV